MRTRPLALLSLAAAAALALAGCSSASPEASPTATTTGAAGDLCAAAAPEGDLSAITVSGDIGQAAEVEFAAPFEITTPERAVVVEGDGTQISDGDYVSYAIKIVDATTGDTLQEEGFGGTAAAPLPISVGSGPDAFFGCATEGSRVVVTTPDQGQGSQIYVLDVLGVTPADAWCAAEEPGDVFPTVEFSGEGVPTITIPEGEAPDGVRLEVLEEGNGEVVEPGDNVTVNYTGVKWSDGSVFDSSWDRGEPATFPTSGVVAGFKAALEGQTVGSTVLVSMAPACGYGEAGSGHELAGETLVFAVDIIETARQ